MSISVCFARLIKVMMSDIPEWEFCAAMKTVPTYELNGDARMEMREDGYGNWCHVDHVKRLVKLIAELEGKHKEALDMAERYIARLHKAEHELVNAQDSVHSIAKELVNTLGLLNTANQEKLQSRSDALLEAVRNLPETIEFKATSDQWNSGYATALMRAKATIREMLKSGETT